jgi:hypothetical protein
VNIARLSEQRIEHMLKSISIIVLTCSLLTFASCSFGDGSVQGCATALTGSFEGDEQGLAFAYMDAELALEFSMVMPDDTPDDNLDNTVRKATLAVGEDGQVTTSSTGVLQVTSGTIDLDTCEVSGSWDLFSGVTTGSFTLGPRNSL